ncbi:MAG: hypothetical protein WA961_14640 [Rhodanobacter sp.]
MLADRGSIAAGGNVTIDQLTMQLQMECLRAHLVACADVPGAIECRHCHLRGLSPDADRCPACQHDVGKERRTREAAAVRRRRILLRLGNLRSLLCYLLAGVTLYGVLLWQGVEQPGALGVLSGGTVFILALGQLFVWGSIGAGIWLRFSLPRLLQRYGLGWVAGR